MNPRHSTPAARRSTKLSTHGGANPDDEPGTNINSLFAQYRRTGTMPSVPLQNPLYGDFTHPQDLHQALEQIDRSNDTFNALPSDVRTLADNDPVKFLAMCEDPDQRALLESAGLTFTTTTEEPTPTSPTTPDSDPAHPVTATPPDAAPDAA